MNSKNRSSDLIRGVKNLQGGYKQFNYNITNKLLEKYKPRVALRLIKGDKNINQEKRAA